MKKIIIMLVVSIFLVQCEPKKQVTQTESMSKNKNATKNNHDIHRIWNLISYDTFDTEKLKKLEAKMDLSQQNQGHAKMGCNSLIFRYALSDKNKININGVVSTRMACVDMSLEDSFNKNISSFTSYSIVKHHLHLKNDKNQEMVFIAEDWD